MLIRFIAKNILSFKDETEFNLFPNKTQRLPHHKVNLDDISFLRLSAIYGANGSGKSNLIKAISLLDSMIDKGAIVEEVDNLKFALCEENKHLPISLGIEFFAKPKTYYYSLTFDKNIILNESLFVSKKEKDELVFERNFENEKQSITFFEDYTANSEKNKLFIEVLEEKLLQKNELLISFLNSKYKDEFIDVDNAFNWFSNTLVVIKPDSKPGGFAHILDTDHMLYDFTNNLLPKLNTGISGINVERVKVDDFFGSDEINRLKTIKEKINKEPEKVTILTNKETGEEASVVSEDEDILVKRLISKHLNENGNEIDFNISMESDGTRRLIDYMPALYDIINDECVYIIDEIERSVHPITIKQIISKISLDETAKGQLIFTTHESCLLDQDILRPDEIWFAQKCMDGSSKFYSLSDFNIHNTANIENGYLNGRYGGIPFLSSFNDLNWHKYEIPQQE